MTSTSAPSLIRVVSFNVRYDTSRDGEDAWPRRKNDVIRFLSELRPTIFGLQEPLKHQVAEIAEGLGAEYARYGVGRDDGKNRGEFNPIFYDKTVLEIIDSGVFWLSETSDNPGTKFSSSSLPRIVTWGRFIIRESSRSFYFFNTHFDHRGQEARLESAVLISRRILELCDTGPAVLIGDFNEERPSDVFHTIESKTGLQCTRDIAKRTENVSLATYTGFNGKIKQTIDNIYSQGATVELYKVFSDKRPNGKRLSDHRPITAHMRL